MFLVNQKIVYPGHGVAVINRIVKKVVAGSITTFYELAFLNKDMTILVPTNNTNSIGIRLLSSSDEINLILDSLAKEPDKKHMNYELNASNWNKRNKEYQNRIRSGNLEEISTIYRDLKHIEQHKELSFGEKNLLAQTETLLAEEIAIVKEYGEEKAVEHLRAIFKDMHSSSAAHVSQSSAS